MKVEQLQGDPRPLFQLSNWSSFDEILDFLRQLSTAGPIPVSVAIGEGIYVFRTPFELRQFAFGMELMWRLMNDRSHSGGGATGPESP